MIDGKKEKKQETIAAGKAHPTWPTSEMRNADSPFKMFDFLYIYLCLSLIFIRKKGINK